LRANKITNSINILLNEDKFSKYSMQQIIDELGEDEFVDYLEKVTTKIIRNLNEKYIRVKPKIVVTSTYKYHLHYPLWGEVDSSFEIRYNDNQNKLTAIRWHRTGAVFGEVKVNEPNFITRWKEELVNCQSKWGEAYGRK
jgi:hypothetical protein